MTDRKRFHFVMIKPGHYDDDGYVIQWARSWIPSNTLTVLNGLAKDCADRAVLGEDVEIVLTAIDEVNTRIDVDKIAREIQASGGQGLIGLVGVQTNQYPRALDLARKFRAHDLQVCIGGFHVSGSIAMLPELPSELQEALDAGVTLFAGEGEGRLEMLLRDAHLKQLEPIYNYMNDLPDLPGSPIPFLPAESIRRIAGSRASFDAGRGCPFMCSFCTIINVQGRKSRYRSADDVEAIVRQNVAQGVDRFFITDDNFARNAVWEELFDRLIYLREEQGLDITLIIQVDTMCHKIPRFIEKAGRAGVIRVFIGLENINPEALAGARKGQNRITEYRSMMQRWHEASVMTYAGYILGFPGDTKETILRDIEIIQRELPIDMLEFFILTPLPGSADHKALYLEGVPMDPDMNNYDTEHVTTAHAKMSAEEWLDIYRTAWEVYYTPEHIETLLRRGKARGIDASEMMWQLLLFSGCIKYENLHPLQGGFWRRKHRHDRRAGMPVENFVSFHIRYLWHNISKYVRFTGMIWQYMRIRRRVEKDPRPYMDLALTPIDDNELDELDLFTETLGAEVVIKRVRRKQAAKIAGSVEATLERAS